MSVDFMPRRPSSLFVTNSGPVSMIDGSEPIEAAPRILARGFRPRALPASSEPIRTPAEPSTMPEELPGVWTWLTRSTSG
ncbi:hypothetical protein D3C81_1784200 [compost metagenome]